MVRAQARSERLEELDQGRAVAGVDAAVPAREFRSGQLRPGLPFQQSFQHDAQAPVLDQGRRALADPLRGWRMKLSSIWKPVDLLSMAASSPGALAADPMV